MKISLILIVILSILSCAVNKASKLHKEIYDTDKMYYSWIDKLDSAEDDHQKTEIENIIREQSSHIVQNYVNSADLIVSRKGFLLLETHDDSLQSEVVKELLISNFPDSEETFELAKEEFYEKLYPVWNEDSLKVDIISGLLKKYPETSWRRTMYQYLLYSLDRIDEIDLLKQHLKDFRTAFPDDYLPYLLSARYLKSDASIRKEVTAFAQKAYKLAYDYPKVEFYPPMEWELEERSAPVKSSALLAEILNEQAEYEKSISILTKVINENSLSVEDETTLCRSYYFLAEAYNGLEYYDLAEKYAILALIEGDSRNHFTPLADSLFDSLLRRYRGFNLKLDLARKRKDYYDVEFSDATIEMGLEDVQAGRIAWGDYDNDGWQDILLNGSRLFRNIEGKKFIEITSIAFPDTIWGNGGLWGDIDNDGDLDVVTKDPESLWLNFGGIFKKFKDFKDNTVSTEGLGLGDVNKDGYLDLYVANYEKDYVYEKDQFFLGEPDLLFKESTEELGLIPEDKINRAGRGVNFGDFDNDGDQDIFVSNYRLTRNFLWVNDGSGYFTDKAQELGVSGNEIDGWWGHTIGSEWGDVDNDGDLDLISCNLAHPRYIDFSNKTMLLYNSGFPEFSFADRRALSMIRFEETHSEPAWGDLNNDGYLDLYINDVYENRRSFLYMNNQDGTFRDVTYLSGTRHFNGWGVAYADFDNDGDLDILAAGGNIQLFRNDTYPKGNWLEVKIAGKDHLDAIGTRLELSKGDVTYIREIQGGKGSTNQHSLIQHFGLGELEPPFDLLIRFPAGEVRNLQLHGVNERVHIKE